MNGTVNWVEFPVPMHHEMSRASNGVGLAANAAVIESPNAITMLTCAGCTALTLFVGGGGIPDGTLHGKLPPVMLPTAPAVAAHSTIDNMGLGRRERMKQQQQAATQQQQQ
jgi:hypothetical protein